MIGAIKTCGRWVALAVLERRSRRSQGPSACHLECRDQWVGWSLAARERNRGLAIGLARFLIRPSLRAPNLASQCYRQLLHRVAGDWWQRYGVRPVLIETYVDRVRHHGRSRAAANWRRLGQGQGWGREDRERKGKPAPKDVGVYQLVENPRAEVSLQSLIAPHQLQTARRMAAERVVLLAQDTTALSYNTRPGTTGLGPIGKDFTRGLFLHSLPAFRLDGIPLGTAWVETWARPGTSDTAQRNEPSVDEKESGRWIRAFQAAGQRARQIPQTPVVARKKSWPPLKLHALWAHEVGTPEGQEPMDWTLLTTWPITRLKVARRIVKWYALRWGIECWHKVLKSVCRVESRQLKSSQALERALAFDLIVASRALLLSRLGKSHPELPAELFYSPEELEVLDVKKRTRANS